MVQSLNVVRIPLAILVVSFSGSAICNAKADQTYELKRTYSVGSSTTYSSDVKFTSSGLSFTGSQLFRDSVEEKLTDGRISVTRKATNVHISINDQESPHDSSQDKPQTLIFEPSGKLSRYPDDPTSGFLSFIEMTQDFVSPPSPVSVGADWTIVKDEDRQGNSPRTEIAYHFASVEKLLGHDAARITYSIKTTGAKNPSNASGVMYVDLKTAVPIRITTKLEAVALNGITGSGTATTTIRG